VLELHRFSDKPIKTSSIFNPSRAYKATYLLARENYSRPRNKKKEFLNEHKTFITFFSFDHPTVQKVY
jgi:hypothetical protein